MKSAILATLIGTAAAFAPAQTGSKASTTAVNSQTRPDLWTPTTSYQNEIGAIAPLGFFDNAGAINHRVRHICALPPSE